MTAALSTLDGIADRFRDDAATVDGPGGDVRPGLRRLGEADLLAPEGSGLPHAVALVERVAGECMSSAFSLWAHRMVIEYLTRGGSGESRLGADLRAGREIGSTAMAPALRDLAGLEPVPVVATRTASGLRLDGPIRWASNLFDGAVVVLPVRLGSEGDGRAVVRIRTGDPGVTVDPGPTLMALNGTASSSMRLDGVEVGADAILSDDLSAFVGGVRPAFLLVQSAFCSGLARRSAAEAERRATGANVELAPDAAAVSGRAADVHRRLHAAAADPSSHTPADLLRIRLDAAGVATDATRLESTVRGGAGYVAGSDVARRLREGAFLPIQSPTEGHLRWELSRSA
ncbi:acyl-CoA dehydrogenase family protein [Pseudonocardia endophytica]|uniref:Alkylation response protein AidB-like acyl-CoA dehydrogenase n=1 Tax=Pseudonocardia endophytica TaxID=401976 RepID=A0A4R1HNT9_PSEEN|nr:acyl-CoA dehydrogenase family protein [Pseudonocardia endophytica]TCK22050.1 alkylation response protein AidB-like acyl-CoA dehydrogenase [Pseudonocardia endophytica]